MDGVAEPTVAGRQARDRRAGAVPAAGLGLGSDARVMSVAWDGVALAELWRWRLGGCRAERE